MATFASLTFGERGSGGGRGFTGSTARAEVAETRIPGGGVVLQVVGRDGPTAFSVAAQGTAAELNALRAVVGTSGDLVWAGGTLSVRLVSISGAEQVVDGYDVWRWTMEVLG